MKTIQTKKAILLSIIVPILILSYLSMIYPFQLVQNNHTPDYNIIHSYIPENTIPTQSKQSSESSEIINIINQVNTSLLTTYLQGLLKIGPRLTGTENCRKAAQYIYDEFNKIGLNTTMNKWRYRCYSSQNIIATLPGNNPTSNAIYVLCAHYDTICNKPDCQNLNDSPGANDDGSGVASMMTIAKIMSQYTFNHTIRFIAFSAEEQGSYGSKHYARQCSIENENIVAVLNLDTIGNATSNKGGKTIQLLLPERDQSFTDYTQSIAKQYFKYIKLNIQPNPNIPCDHDAFNKNGYDGVMFLQYDPLKHIHSPRDTLQNINMTYLVKATKLFIAITASIANHPLDLQVRIETPQEGGFYLFDTLIHTLPIISSRNQYAKTYILGRCTAKINVTTSEEIEKIIYCIDGDFRPTTHFSTDLKWPIQGYDAPLTGNHRLSVYVYTISGNIAYDEMDIYCLFCP